MRVTLTTEGGLAYFPALAKPVTVDSAALPPDQADELQRLIAAADFFNRPSEAAPPPPGAADYRTYTLTVDDGARAHTIRTTDIASDPTLNSLLVFIKGLRGASGAP